MVNSTLAALTPGLTPAALLPTPKTTHGCRALSVKIQPKELAKMGRRGITNMLRTNHRLRGNRPRRINQSASNEIRAANAPKPIIKRKLQYANGIFGV